MAIERVRRVGPYAPLSATYYQDDDIAEAGEGAELLYLRGLAFGASRPHQDGFISETQLHRYAGVGMEGVTERAARLVDVGLWERVEGGYVVRAWLKWNKSADEIGSYRSQDRERKRKAREDENVRADVRAESETLSERSPSGRPSGVRQDSETLSDTHNTTQQKEQLHTLTAPPHEAPHEAPHEVPQTASPSPSPASRSRTPAPGSDQDPDWQKFWGAFPQKRGKKEARTAWAKAIKARHDPQEIIAGAERYAAEVTRERIPSDKVKYAQGWLNGERWTDELSSATPSSPEAWWNN